MAGVIELLVLLVALIILWVIVSLPTYFAAKIVTAGRSSGGATLGEAMWATLAGAVVYFLVLVVVSFSLGTLIGAVAGVFAVLLAFIAWLAVYRSVFHVGWLGAMGIAIISVIVIFVMNLILAAVLGVSLPHSFHLF